jgi:hypothetical protein
MLKFTAKMTLVVAMLGMGACAYSHVNEEPRSPSSYTEEKAETPRPWHFPYIQKGTSRAAAYY